MGLGQNFFTRFRPGQFFCGSGWVGSAIYGLGLNLENFPYECQIFQFFPFRSKRISLGWVKKYPGQRQVSLLFAASQKWSRVGSGPISSSIPGHASNFSTQDCKKNQQGALSLGNSHLQWPWTYFYIYGGNLILNEHPMSPYCTRLLFYLQPFLSESNKCQ